MNLGEAVAHMAIAQGGFYQTKWRIGVQREDVGGERVQ